jgi:hypothetical protein
LKSNVAGDFLGDCVLVPPTASSSTLPAANTAFNQTGSNGAVQPLPVNLDNLDGCGFQLVTSGTLTGTWKVEVSNNYVSITMPALSSSYASGAVVWTDVTAQFSPAITNPAGSATNQFVQMYPLVARWVRITLTVASGTGNTTITYCAKGNR